MYWSSPQSSLSASFSKYSLLLLAIILVSVVLSYPGQHNGNSYFLSPSISTTWNLGETVVIRFRYALNERDSSQTMLYLEYDTRLCQGPRPDDEFPCDSRATKVSVMGQIAPGADSFSWTIPTTLDLQLTQGRFHLYDHHGHISDSFTIRPSRKHYYHSREIIDEIEVLYLDEVVLR